MALNTTRIGELLGVDPADSNALALAVKDFLALGAVSTISSKTRRSEDFLGLGATLADNPSVLITQSGTALTPGAINATAGPVPVGHLGWIGGKTDDVDAEIDEVALGKKPWLSVAGIPTGGRIFGEIGFVIPTALTARQYFFGLTDSETEGTGTNGSLNIQTATTVVDVADNAAGFIFSSLATSPTHFHMANTNATVQAYVGDSALVAIVDNYTRLRVEIDATGKAFYYGAVTTTRDAVLPLLTTKALAVATTSLLIPLFTAAPTTTTGVEWEIDYMDGGIV
jgi:hypothetical protein